MDHTTDHTRPGTSGRRAARISLAAAVSFSLAALLLPAPPAEAVDNFFQPLQSMNTGTEPYDVEVADVDQDGGLDFIVAASKNHQISVIEGPDDGVMGSRRDFMGGGNPLQLAVGDLNRDGDPDVVSVGSGTSNASIMYGRPSDAFASPVGVQVGSRPIDVQIADFNQDGIPDIATADYDSGTVSILKGHPDNHYVRFVHEVGTSPTSLGIGDFNGDGDPDIATTWTNGTAGGRVSVLLGTAGIGFGPPTDFVVEQNSAITAVGDLNKDGDPDLVLVHTAANKILVMLGGAGGTFGAATGYVTPLRPFDTAIADVNRDGHPDVSVSSAGANALAVYRGSATGTLHSRSDRPGGGTFGRGIVAGDFNGDKAIDLALVQRPDGGGSLSVLFGFPQAEAALTPTSIDLGSEDVGGFSDAETVTLTNTGGVDLLPGAATLTGADAGDFTTLDFCAGQKLVPGASCEIEVRLTPFTAGAKSAVLQVPHGAPGSPDKVNLSGTAIDDTDDPPQAVDDVTTLHQGSGATPIEVLDNDLDDDGGPITIVDVTQPGHGTVAIDGDGSAVTYQPDAGYCNDPGPGPADEFTYTLNGGSTATVAVTVTCAGEPPVDDPDAPETTIRGGWKGTITWFSKRGAIRFVSSERGSTFECRVDGGSYTACKSPYRFELSNGLHQFEVRARSAAGVVDPTPASTMVKVRSLRLF